MEWNPKNLEEKLILKEPFALAVPQAFIISPLKTISWSVKSKKAKGWYFISAFQDLVESYPSVKQTAWGLHFPDTSNFISFFKKNTGTLPRQFLATANL